MEICVLGLRGFPLIEGGVEKHCESLYTRMDESITVFRRAPFVSEECRNASASYRNIHFIDLPSTRIKGFETVFHSFLASRKAASLNPDIVHIHNIGPAMFSGILKKHKIPIVLTFHSPNYEHSKWSFFARKLLKYCEKVAFKNADRIIFVNRFQMEKSTEEIIKKSVYIPNGINQPLFLYNTDFLTQVGVSPNKYILAVGRITPEKGFDILIKAFKASRHEGFKLVIAGGVEYENGYMEELKALANEDVVFTGYVFGNKLAQLYTNAALFVLSSNNEGFPLVLLEAMSYGLDVLVSDIPATHLVKLNEADYFQKGNDSELAELISTRLKNGEKREYDLKEYDWNDIAKATGNVYCEAMGK